ncbi:V0/A0 complex, 116-kDa subunit of ATPase [Ascodesmis nigricans]|uniref:V-type proton ATPase subunit a n=1 Tax=Ascodesmis nigricans TaxID=341454 RepID=A0A4S2N6M0_9PEZI|nr:V0/A0 complex, 116-kDa subunit of ATPase [Ascodesmis nigricans]
MARPDTLFRSAEMSLVQLYVPTEIGRETVSALGEVGLMQFRDLNEETSAFQRTFTKEIRRLDNVERQLRFFAAQMEKNNISVRPVPGNGQLAAAPSSAEIDTLNQRAEAMEARIIQLNNSYETLQKRWVELIEYRWVLREAGGFFDRAHHQADDIRRGSTDEPTAPLLEDIENLPQTPGAGQGELSFQTMNIGFVSGVIPRERIAAFERILWRTLRGNLYMNQSEIEEPMTDPATGEDVHKNVFVIFAHGKEILSKIRKISESLGADLYSVDEDANLRRDQLLEVNNRISDLRSVLDNTKNTLDAELRMIANDLAGWMVVIKKEKAVYQTLNRFNYDAARKYLVAEGWLPKSALPLIQNTLREVTDQARIQVPSIMNELKTSRTPPTYIKTNKFTEGFQTIINAYGTAKYQEVNPGLATIVTFPFLFAVMFGDIGHGFLMALAAAAMIYYEKNLIGKKVQELFDMAFFGRYIMLLMGVFSIYTGFIYNDIFSKPVTLFESAWEWPEHFEKGQPIEATKKDGYVYPFGIDWNWHPAENNLLFTNSYKMKLSIIMGWAHMTYSLCLSQYNHRFFRSRIDTIGNFIPGMLFLQSIFGYLVMCMIYKWTVDWVAIGKPAPSLLNMLINMFLSPGTIEDQLYPGQKPIQIILTLIAAVCIPWMLLLKPLWLRHEHNKHRAQGYRGIGEVSRVSALGDDDDDHLNSRPSEDSDAVGHAFLAEELHEEEEFDFSEEMIHQVIHTIEFCLNCVSHTASYLRLWALSLAHAQLSAVLWTMTIGLAFGPTGTLGVIMTVVLFAMWFTLTIAILVVMEGTSAMLHSLRLHWVEAMSKFFIGDGVPFEPFSFTLLLEEESAG